MTVLKMRTALPLFLLACLAILLGASSAFAAAPVASGISLNTSSRVVTGNVSDADGDSITDCYFAVEYDDGISATSLGDFHILDIQTEYPSTTFTPNTPGVLSSGVCSATISGAVPDDTPMRIELFVEANGETTSIVLTPNPVFPTGGPTNAAPVVTDVSLISGTLSASAIDSDGTIVNCSFLVEQGAYSTTVSGTYDLGTQLCTAPLPSGAPHGTLTVTATATDDDGAEGSDANVLSNPNTPPSVGTITLTGQTLSAPATDVDGNVVSCTVRVVQGAYNQLFTGTVGPGTCSLQLPASAPHGVLTVTVNATDNDGAVGTHTNNVDFANSTPVVSDIKLTDKTITAKAVDSDGTIASCTLRVQKEGYNQLLTGTYNATTQLCSATLPADAPKGTLTVTATATDNDGATGQIVGSVELPNLPPVASNTRVDTASNQLLATIVDADGSIVSCRFTVVSGAYSRTITGSYNAAAKECSAPVPADYPTSGDVLLTAYGVDNDNAEATDNKIVAAPPVTVPVDPQPPVVIDEGPDEAEAITQCSGGKMVVTDLRRQGKFAVMTGYAPKSKAGQTVSVKALFKLKKVVAKTKVQPNGSWTVKAPLPAKRFIGTNRAMYQAVLGKQSVPYLKLTRYLTTTQLKGTKGGVIVKGHVEKKYPGQKVDVTVSVNCAKATVASSLKVDKKGNFAGTVNINTTAKTVVIRLRTKAKTKATSKKAFYTYTINQPVALLK